MWQEQSLKKKTFVVSCRMRVPNIVHLIHVDTVVCFIHFNGF